jgi:hypothetical protein
VQKEKKNEIRSTTKKEGKTGARHGNTGVSIAMME